MSRPRVERGLATVLAALLLSAGAAQAASDDGNNKILYPDAANLTFNYLDTVNVAYATDYDTPWLYLWCRDASGNRQEIVYYSPSDVLGKTAVPVKLQSNTQYTGTTCWFNLLPGQVQEDVTSQGATSPEFSYVKAEADQKTFSLSASSSASSSTPTATSTPTTVSSVVSTPASGVTTGPTVSATAGAEAASTSGTGLSTGAKAGIAVAAALVGIGIVAAVVWTVCRRRRRQAGAAELAADGATTPKEPEVETVKRHELASDRPPGEMESQWQPYVLAELEDPGRGAHPGAVR
ncbi:hypothetical protein JX266_003866 [Neoarthrinium moseri]|nr:hypothetical protein JX266_003866 [Neoarthrinium moseri]